MGDSKDYYEYVNRKEKKSETNAQMAYYGSTQCNYYDAPFVNVLNTLLTGYPKPSKKYAFSSFPWDTFDIRNTGYTVHFDGRSVCYQGEIYYYAELPSSATSSVFLVTNTEKADSQFNKNGYYGGQCKGKMYAVLFEDQMSLELNGGDGGFAGTYIGNEYNGRGNYLVHKYG